MAENLDPMDYLDDYEIYEDKYADELDEVGDFEEEEVDFNVVLKRKQENKLDPKFDVYNFQTNITKDEPLQNNGLSKRRCSEIEEACKESKENLSPLGLKPKKLKLDELDFDIDWGIESSNTTIIKDKSCKIIDQLKYQPSKDDSFNVEAYNMNRQRVFCRPVFGVDLLNVTSTDGDRVFLKLCAEDDIPAVEEKRWLSHSSGSGLNLLSVPFDQLKNEVIEKMHIRMVQSRDHLPESQQNNDNNKKEVKDVKSTELWVEKYMPRTYTELLSDDGTNRFILKWLKLWDEVVFGVEPDKQKGNKYEEKDAESGNFQKKDGKNNFQKKYYDPEDDLVKDSKGRPKKKIALLCGNPGLGKTTLAHVISQHAGYKVVEMNASDDRTPEVFLNKIETSTQMKAVMGQTKRPNCLVIDEIDGAPIQAINILLELVKRTDSFVGKGAKSKKKRKKREFILNRPIICICNDQFVPALRQLRQVAFTLKFPPTLPSRLAGRLLAISQMEQLRIDMSALLMLADKSENDIRSCLNTLQFIQRKKKHVKQEDLTNLEIGQKDMKKGVRVIIAEVFQLPKSNKKKFIGKFTTGSDSKSTLTNRFHYILHLVSGNSEFEKIMQGLFDQYLNSKTKDPYLESINLANEWIGFTDILQKKVSKNQDYVLWRFLSFLPVAFHMFFARATCGKVPYSNVAYENHLKLTHNLQTLQLMTSGMNPHLRRNCQSNIMTTDLVPYLFLVTLPNLRPVNTKLYSESEKQIFSSLINTLISYNLTYRQERNLEGQYTYVLEPNIEELVTYTGLAQHRQLLYATKQLIGREVEMEKMRQADRIIKKGDESAGTSIDSSITKSAGSTSHKRQLQPKKIDRYVDRPQLDFFGRVIKPNTNKNKEVKSKKTKDDQRITLVINTSTWFRFNEGYTNAVRRTIKLPEFL